MLRKYWFEYVKISVATHKFAHIYALNTSICVRNEYSYLLLHSNIAPGTSIFYFHVYVLVRNQNIEI